MRRQQFDDDREATLLQAGLHAATAAYEDAGLRGLCVEGRWEFALQAIRALDLTPFLESADEDLLAFRLRWEPQIILAFSRFLQDSEEEMQ